MTDHDRSVLEGRAVLLYDGHCGLCNFVVRFFARRDAAMRMRYVPLQSEVARELLARYGETPESLNSAALLVDALTPKERFYHHSDAVAGALRLLERPWSWLGRVVRWTPRFLRDAVYRFIGSVRYRIFGRYSSCPRPHPEMRSRFLGVTDPGCVGT